MEAENEMDDPWDGPGLFWGAVESKQTPGRIGTAGQAVDKISKTADSQDN